MYGSKRVFGSDFFQFKRSDYLANRRGLPEDQRFIGKDFFDCYRFKLYNSPTTRQFDTLRRLARGNNNYCAYIAPLFYQFAEFDRFFSNGQIMENSVEIDCLQFNRGEFSELRYGDDEIHHILFNRRSTHCWFCSKPQRAFINRASYLVNREVSESITFESHLDEILILLVEFQYIGSQYFDGRINQKIRVIRETLYREANIFWFPRFERLT
jgi:hypothetical protein